MRTKSCSRCKKTKRLASFHKRIVNGADVGQTRCRKCMIVVSRAQRKADKLLYQPKPTVSVGGEQTWIF